MSFSSMYIAATGMISLSTGLQTVSNNLANIETNAYKTMRTNYSDLLSETLYTGSGLGRQQVGLGSQVQSIQSMFTQGAFKTSESPLDLALAGDGFFAVRHRRSYHLPLSDEILYTRAGAYTLDKEGYMEDPSGNILQGWALSIPRPGERPVRLGSPVDVQITAMTIPPRATTILRQAVNLNAAAEPAYVYSAYAQAERYARAAAEPAGEAARTAAKLAVWNPGADSAVSAVVSSAGTGTFIPSNRYDYNRLFVGRYNSLYLTSGTAFAADGSSAALAWTVASAMSLVTPPPDPVRTSGQMTYDEFSALTALTAADMAALASAAGRTAYTGAYQKVYDAVYGQYSTGQPQASQWLWEGQGYAGAWDGSRRPPIDPANYSHAEYRTVYDQNGRSHVLTTYYQKNPHSENVWDYIVVCEPEEDDRPGMAGSPLAGLLQKGKITFTASGATTASGVTRYGGVIKDIEAQDLDPAASRAAWVGPPVNLAPGLSTAMSGITIGGSYGGPGVVGADGRQVSSSLTYQIVYGYRDPDTGRWRSANTSMSPPAQGFTWIANNGTSGFVALDTRQVSLVAAADYAAAGYPAPGTSAAAALTSAYAAFGYPDPYSLSAITIMGYGGPYALGADGLTLTFNFDPTRPGPALARAFGQSGATIASSVTAHSEQTGWRADSPNADGYFDANVKFKDAPPQNIALNFGARQAGGLWLRDEVSTTQYAGAYVTAAGEQDGYPRGDFSRLYITDDGLVTGVYSNKLEIPLYQLSIYRFLNPWGLQKVGDNLFGVTRHSGPAGEPYVPGEGGAATVLGGFLEQSNVDTATEIVNMIMTQRGFQANSKVITTHDTMISTAIETKR